MQNKKSMEKTNSIVVLREKSQRVGITIEITTGKTLISIVEGSEMLLSLDDFENFLPFFLAWITSCWVMGAHVQKNNLLIICFVKIFKHTI